MEPQHCFGGWNMLELFIFNMNLINAMWVCLKMGATWKTMGIDKAPSEAVYESHPPVT